jgi:hypothetical protein
LTIGKLLEVDDVVIIAISERLTPFCRRDFYTDEGCFKEDGSRKNPRGYSGIFS